MGLRDKIAAKFASMGIDHSAALAPILGAEDPVVACAGVLPAAYKRGGGTGPLNGTQIAMKAIDAAANKVSGNRHTGGEEGSVAATLPREGELAYLAMSARGLSLWDFGMNGQQTPPTLMVRIDGEQVRSVVDTGKKAQGGAAVVRFTFTDDSFFDYRVMPGNAAFIEAAAARWPA
ncbi:hypothetical protein [Nocardioides daejeonensis]|uniref:hypothetical protein n=1 Tax=Nocardioides daejeonensis TaxID=1046556 RepID=UPI000D748992|nr:hypothetical protein [Nocardioides daejeonensis]